MLTPTHRDTNTHLFSISTASGSYFLIYFSHAVFYTKAKEHSLPYYLPIAGGKNQ